MVSWKRLLSAPGCGAGRTTGHLGGSDCVHQCVRCVHALLMHAGRVLVSRALVCCWYYINC